MSQKSVKKSEAAKGTSSVQAPQPSVPQRARTDISGHDFELGMIVESVWSEILAYPEIRDIDDTDPDRVYIVPAFHERRPSVVVGIMLHGIQVAPVFSGERRGIEEPPLEARVACTLIRNEGETCDNFHTEVQDEWFNDDRIVYAETPSKPNNTFKATKGAWINVFMSKTILFEHESDIDIVGSLTPKSTNLLLDFHWKILFGSTTSE